MEGQDKGHAGGGFSDRDLGMFVGRLGMLAHLLDGDHLTRDEGIDAMMDILGDLKTSLDRLDEEHAPSE